MDIESTPKLARHAKYFAFAIYSLPFVLLFSLYCMANVLDAVLHLYLLLIPVLLLPTILIGAWWLLWMVRKILRRRWTDALCMAGAPLAALTLILLLGVLGFTPSWIRFQLSRARYEQRIASCPLPGPKLAAFNWNDIGGGAASSNVDALIYDESDEIGLAPTDRSRRWNERANRIDINGHMASILQGETDTRSVLVRPMGGHFYLVSEVYR